MSRRWHRHSGPRHRTSASFYQTHLGFEQVQRYTTRQPYVQRLVGYHPDVTLEIALLAVAQSDVFLEILEYRGVAGTAIDPSTANAGIAHFCLFVDDLDSLYARLVSAGVQFVSDVQVPTVGPNAGGRIVYMKDPDGVRIELVETSRRPDGSERH